MSKPVYYNDNDPFAARWLRNLVSAGLLPAGDVDDRSITEVKPNDLKGYEQCHFFAGIGGWPLALEWAGWRGPVWTGSCPCQPLSSAGQHQGHADERHVWPAFFSLIAECRPVCVFGEQSASKDGREWLSGVRADLETLGYACGGADLPAASVAAPHVRSRLYWVADAEGSGYQRFNMEGTSGQVAREIQQRERFRDDVGDGHPNRGLGDSAGAGLEGRGRPEQHSNQRVSAAAGPWGDYEWVWCAEPKAPSGGFYRRVEPSILLLADGIPARMGKLRGLGNAVVPQVAAVFIQAFMECEY